MKVEELSADSWFPIEGERYKILVSATLVDISIQHRGGLQLPISAGSREESFYRRFLFMTIKHS